MGNYMSGNSITKNFTTALLTESVKLAWVLIRIGQHWDASRGPLVVTRLYKRILSAGEALEGWTEGTAGRLGIDILRVLEPIVEAHVG